MMLRTFIALAAWLLTVAVAAQSPEAERKFREWATERVETLKTDRDVNGRADAAEYLGGFEYPDVIAALTAALRDPEPRVRAAAAGALWKTGKAAESAREALRQALDDREPAVAIRAAGALETLGVRESELVAARERVLDAPGVATADRFMAARGLVGHAPATRLLDPILQFLERAAMPRPTSSRSIAERESLESATATLQRLAKTGDRALIAPIVDALRTARYSQPALLDALAAFRPKPPGWTDLLIRSLDAPDSKTRRAALALLGGEIDEKAVAAWAPRAADLLRDSDDLVRSEALWSLGRAGGLAAGSVDAVVAVLADPDPAMRRRAAATLGEMGEQTQAVPSSAKQRVATRARPQLAALAENDGDEEVRAEAKRALARLVAGPAAAVAAPSSPAARSANPAAEASAVALLRERKIAMEPGAYFQALAATDVAVVRAFLDAGLSASAPVAGNGPPLVVALQVGDACAPGTRPTKPDTKALVKLLLERGADANASDSNGFTPLMAAAMKGCDREVMRSLIAAGAKVDARNPTGLTAFDFGLFSGHDGLEELIAAGYRLPPEKVRTYEQAYAGKPAVLALVRKAARR